MAEVVGEEGEGMEEQGEGPGIVMLEGVVAEGVVVGAVADRDRRWKTMTMIWMINSGGGGKQGQCGFLGRKEGLGVLVCRSFTFTFTFTF